MAVQSDPNMARLGVYIHRDVKAEAEKLRRQWQQAQGFPVTLGEVIEAAVRQLVAHGIHTDPPQPQPQPVIRKPAKSLVRKKVAAQA